MATRYRAMAAPVDKSTGDGRRFAPGAIIAADPPLPIRYVREDIGSHDGAVVVGRMDDITVEEGAIYGVITMFDDVDPQKMPKLAESVHEAMKLIDEGVLGLSVDLDDFDAEVVARGADAAITPAEPMDSMIEKEVEDEDGSAEGEELELLITRGRIRAATLVSTPAFAETKGSFERLGEVAMVASVSGDTELPVLEDRERPWDGPGAAGRVLDACSDEDGMVDKACASKAFLWVDGDGTKRGHYKLPFADIVDGELRIIPRGVAATAGGRGVGVTDGVDKEAVGERICALYARVRSVFEDWPECPLEEIRQPEADDREAAVRAIIASATMVDTRTAFDAFTPPVTIDAPTPMTYDFDRGMVYGHIYQHGVCHVGIPHECRTPPVDEDFRHFHVYPVETTEGTVFAGRITAGAGHADRANTLTAVRAVHDQMTTVAHVRASVDDHGIFVCGPLETGLDAETLGILSRRKVSGHWPEVGNQGEIFLAEILALGEGAPQDSEPGFPVGVHVRSGRVVGMTAALGPMPEVLTVTVMSDSAPEHFRMTAEGVATLFRETYRLMEEEKAERVWDTLVRVGLQAALDADAEMMRVKLARAIGE